MAKVSNKKFSKPVAPKLEGVTLELSVEEAKLLRFLAGRVMNGSSDNEFSDAGRSIWTALSGAGVPSISDRVSVYTGCERHSSFSVKKD